MATLIRFREPFRELAALQNEMARVLGGAFEGGNGRTNQAWMPAVDVWETVSAERERSDEVSDERFYRFERRFGSFSRTIGLPQGTSEDAINANYQNGVLEVHVRKPEQPKPKRIQVGKGAQATIEGSAEQSQ